MHFLCFHVSNNPKMDINGSNSHLFFIKCRHFGFDEIAYGTDTQTGS